MKQFFHNKVNEKILDKVYDILVRMEERIEIIEKALKKEKPKKKLLHD